MKPLCFVLMPFGTKKDQKGRDVDFNEIYQELIKPAIEACDIEPIRADEELAGGTIHKPMYERLILCDYAIADLTSLNANVFYELGLRHAIKEYTTIPIFAFDADLPFDLKMERTVPYTLDDKGKLSNRDTELKQLIAKLEACKKNQATDSPVFQMVEGWDVIHNLSDEKTDVFRDRAIYDNKMKERLFAARSQEEKEERKQAVMDIFEELRPLNEKRAGVVMDLFLSLRDVQAHDEMITCYEEMDAPLQNVKVVQEQLGFAYNRAERKEEAIQVLSDIIKKYGNDPETNGLLGRVYKDLYNSARRSKDRIKAKGFLKQAIDNYKEGFDADWRDFFPGINLVNLLDQKGEKELLASYLPIVKFAVERKVENSEPNYWDKATQAELCVLNRDYDGAEDHLADGLAIVETKKTFWMLKSTLDNFTMLQEVREENGVADTRLTELIEGFTKYLPKEEKNEE